MDKEQFLALIDFDGDGPNTGVGRPIPESRYFSDEKKQNPFYFFDWPVTLQSYLELLCRLAPL